MIGHIRKAIKEIISIQITEIKTEDQDRLSGSILHIISIAPIMLAENSGEYVKNISAKEGFLENSSIKIN